MNCQHMNHEHHACCVSGVAPSTHQTLDELDFERGIWSAALNGDYDKTNTLLKRGTDPNSRDQAGYSALHYSARNGHHDVCQLLLDKGADPNARTKAGGVTPLHRAAYCGHYDIVKFLLKRGANPLICDEDNKTALHKAVERKQVKTVELLLSHHMATALKEMKDKRGKTALEYCEDPNLKLMFEKS